MLYSVASAVSGKPAVVFEQSGFNARWRHLRNAYLELDGWRYWAMRTSAR